MSSDRAAVAREVLTEMAQRFRDDPLRTLGETGAQLVEAHRDQHYPAPAAPVTVDGVEWELLRNGQWASRGKGYVPSGVDGHRFLSRIASDARRIEALDAANASLKAETDRISAMRQDALDELVRVGSERDEACGQLDAIATAFGNAAILDGCATLAEKAAMAMREGKRLHDENVALRCVHVVTQHGAENMTAYFGASGKAATSQGEGHGIAPDTATPTLGNQGQSAPASPAPIPLGAVVSTSEYDYEFDRLSMRWECMQGDPPVGHPVDPEVEALCCLAYQLQHPVADAATVKRVAQAILDNDREQLGPSDWEWNVVGESVRGSYLSNARAALRALGYTIQEGA